MIGYHGLEAEVSSRRDRGVCNRPVSERPKPGKEQVLILFVQFLPDADLSDL